MSVWPGAAEYEVAVVGGGVVGGALAALLGGAGVRVALIEAHVPPAPGRARDEARVLALTRASERVLRAVGAWRHIEAAGPGVFREMHVWDAGGLGSIHFDSAAIGEPLLGHIVAIDLIEEALETVLAHLPLVTQHRPARLESITVEPQRARILLKGGEHVTASLVAGADGAGSSVRSLAAIENRVVDYRQSALVCTVSTERPHTETARQRFLPSGPLAFLPLADPHRCAIVWSTGRDQAEALLGYPEPEFRRRLAEASAGVLGYIVEIGPRTLFPLARAHAERYVGPRLALVGDAAHRIHPLAGLGANLGLMDAASLAEVVLAARADARDPGALRVLRRYERWRKGENLAVMWLMDAFKGLFGSEWQLLTLVRNLGLRLVDGAMPLKQAIMRRAMGLEGDLPKVALGRRP